MIVLLLLLACASTDKNADTATPGTGTISGSFGGRAFDTIAAAWRIGQPDDPDQTMVVYLFDQDIACADIGSPAWDETVTDQTQSVEIKIIGLVAGDYPIAAGRTPAEGESDANYTLTSTSGTPTETSVESGDVGVESADGGAASGTFDLAFSTGDALTGTFDATPCSEGHEP